MPNLVVVSGGQTGADEGALRAAKAAGIATDGWCPKGFLTEAGPRPDLAALYGLKQMPTKDYPDRTRQNVAMSDAVLWFGDSHSAGGKLTLRLARTDNLPCWVVVSAAKPELIAGWITRIGCRYLMVAGNRESKAPGIGQRVEEFMTSVFNLLRETDHAT